MTQQISHTYSLNRFMFIALRNLAIAIILNNPVFAATTTPTANPANPPANTPPPVANGTTPSALLTISKDHESFYKAFDDYSDLTGDGVPDTTYINSVIYYGYFDSYKCYTYNTAPSYNYSLTGTKQATFEPTTAVDSNNYCNTGTITLTWSGNFLNWLTMTRMDVIRKILYGGLRTTDTGNSTSTDSTTKVTTTTPGVTVLARSYLPTDAHSFAKFYNGSDITKLTPYSSTTVSNGITFCNTTVDSVSPSQVYSQSITAPPVFRVALGNYSMWANNEGWQCKWSSETTYANGNNQTYSGLPAISTVPDSTTITPNVYNVLVAVCASPTLIGHENCKTYPDGTLKPIGLLQTYGDNNQMNFGLMTGSYAKNTNGGVLRKNLGTFTDEVNINTNGTFNAAPTGTAPTANIKPSGTGPVGIVNTLNLLRLYGYNHSTSQYFKTATTSGGGYSVTASAFNDKTANCSWGLMSATGGSFPDGSCSNWGNPQAEMFLEALRYLGNQDASGDFLPATSSTSMLDSSYISGLSVAATNYSTTNKILSVPSSQWCAKQSIINFTSSSTSYDANKLSGIADINGNSSSDPSSLTDTVGTTESIPGTSVFVGSLNTSLTDANNNILCTPKTVSKDGTTTVSLSTLNGTCPDAPSLLGTYQIAGLAWFGNTTDLEPTGVQGNQTVTTFGVALAPNLPSVTVAVPGSNTQTVSITPACQDNTTGLNCTATAFQIVSQSCTANSIVSSKVTNIINTSGSGLTSNTAMNCGLLYANFDDSAQGGDYDMDLWGTLIYVVTSTNVYITTQVFYESTNYSMSLGYILSGTNHDGYHAHSGINGYAFSDTNSGTLLIGSSGTGSNAYCTNCNPNTPFAQQLIGNPTTCPRNNPNCNTYQGDVATTVMYAPAATGTTSFLKQPLWYASKWGGFTYDSSSTVAATPTSNTPTKTTQWDSNNDGVPDHYFYATNPSSLSTSLAYAFQAALGQITSASSAALSSTTLTPTTSSTEFAAQFSSTDWHGDLFNVTIQSNGLINYKANGNTTCTIDNLDSNWDAANKIPAASARNIFTFNGTKGAAFLWPSLSTGITSASTTCNTNPSGSTTAQISCAQMHTLDTGLNGTVGPDSLGGLRLNWLRGDTSQELRNNGGIFRNRAVSASGQVNVLGDIVDSSPVYTQAEDYGFSKLPTSTTSTEQSGYATYVTNKAKRTPMVYVGANDGMLHGFQADISQTNSGVEQLAYIPAAVFGNLSSLTDPSYTHHFFVDGTPTVSDAYLNGSWQTVLVGGLNSGGSAIYALNISTPTSFTATNVMWEYSDTTGNLGLTYSQPQIARLNNGSWAAIFGNGYMSANGHAILYIVNLNTGDLITTIDTNFANANNGLSTPVLYDSNNDSIIDYVYAGDLQGNLWKFDLTDSVKANWAVANKASPLFTGIANNVYQPITVKPTLVANSIGGVNISFGTGSFISLADMSNTNQQTFYSVWDNPKAKSGTTLLRSNLVAQTLTAITGTSTTTSTCQNDSITNNLRTITNNTVDYTNSKVSGWYIDFISSGERVISQAVPLGAGILISSVVPSIDPCSAQGNGWLMDVNALSGGTTSPFGSTVANLAAYQLSFGMGSTPFVLTSSTGATSIGVQSGASGGGTTNNTTSIPGPTSSGACVNSVCRQFWQQIQ